MKKYLLLFATLLTVFAGFAQTEESPIALTLGETGTYTNSEGSYSTCCWTFTASSDVTVKVSVDNGYYWAWAGSFTSDDYWNSGARTVAAGETIYIKSTTYDSNGVHSVTVSEVSSKGTTTDDPVIVDPAGGTYDNGSESYSNFYYSYTATEDGLLKISANDWYYIDVNGGTQQYGSYENGAYYASQAVTAGETYLFNIRFYSGSPVTFTITHPKAGCWDMPITLVEGDNEIPANVADGDVWYTFTPTVEGNYVITGTGALSTDQITVWSYDYYAKNKMTSSAVAISEVGSLDITIPVEMSWGEFSTYYVLVSRANTPFPGNLNLKINEFEEGDTKGSAIAIDPLPFNYTQTAKGKKWYTITVPQSDTNRNLVVKATSEVNNANTLFDIRSSYSSYISGNKGATYEVNSQWGDQTLYIQIDNEEDGDLSFNINLEEIAQGDASSNPILLTAGETYTIDKEGNRFYKYVGTEDKPLQFVVSNADMVIANVSYSEPTWSSSSKRTISEDGLTYTFSSAENCTQIFCVSNASLNDTFTFSETEYAPGASKSTAIEVTDGAYTLDDKVQDVWIKYTATGDDLLTIAADGIDTSYDPSTYVSNSISYITGTSTYETSIADWSTSTWHASISVAKGQEVLVHVKTWQAYPDAKITFTEAEPGPGETPGTAIIIYGNVTTDLAPNTNLWYKFYATETAYTSVHVVPSARLSIKKYDNYDDAVSSSNGYWISWNTEDYVNYYSDPYTEEGWNYLQINNSYSDTQTILITGNIEGQDSDVPVLQQTYPQSNTKISEIPDQIIFMFNQEITSVEAAAIQSGENDPVMIDASKCEIKDGNSVYVNVADVKSQMAAGNITVYVQVNGIEDAYEANFTLGAEFGPVSNTLAADGGKVMFSENIDFVDYATEATCNVSTVKTKSIAAQATLTLDDDDFTAINVAFSETLVDGDYTLDIPAATIMSTSGEQYVGGSVAFTVAGGIAKFIGISPTEGESVNLDTEFIVTFSKPVKCTKYLSGIKAGYDEFDDGNGATVSYNDDQTEIHVTFDKSFLAMYGVTDVTGFIKMFGSDIQVLLYKVKDVETGEALEGNDPDEDNQFTFSYTLGDGKSVMRFDPEDGTTVESLKDILVSCKDGLFLADDLEGKNILFMYNKENVETIAASDIQTMSAEYGASDYFAISLSKEYTEAGTYELYIPAGVFTINGEPNEITIATWTIAGEASTGIHVSPAAGEVTSLKDFTLTYGDGTEMISPSYSYDMTITDETGAVWATITSDDIEIVEYSGEGWDAVPSKLTFSINEITTPGTYTLNIPASTFIVGENFDWSEETSFTWTITVADGINGVNADDENVKTYNLAGQRVKASTKGIVIKNGKKYLKK